MSTVLNLEIRRPGAFANSPPLDLGRSGGAPLSQQESAKAALTPPRADGRGKGADMTANRR